VSSAIANGVRAAVATLVPFFLAAALGRAELAWMALGGWLGTLTDPGGLRSTRVKALASFAVLGAIVVPVAERSASSTWLATLVLAVVTFAGTLARALGPAAATVGTMMAIVAAVGTARTGDASSYAADALYFAAGAAWATLLSSLVWTVSTHRPVRQAIAVVFQELSAYAMAVAIVAGEKEAGEAWSEVVRTHHRRIRAAIEEALAIALAVRAKRNGESAVGADLRVLLGMAEAQFPKLIALSVELEGMDVKARPAVVRKQLRALSATYDAIRRTLIASRSGPDGIPSPPRTAMPAAPQAVSPATVHAARLEEESEQARALAGSLGTGTSAAARADRQSLRPSLAALTAVKDELRELRDALSIGSVFFRHAVRVTAAVVVASAVGHRIALQPHWVTVTTIAVLQPYPGPTSTRAAERVVGTVLGCAVAAVITMTIRSPLALAGVMFPLSVAAVATRARSYRLFTFFLTPVFVLIAERHPGDSWTAAARAGDSVIGGIIALAAALLLFPSWEKTRLPDAIEKMVVAVSRYRDIVIASLDRRGADETGAIEHDVAEARRAAGIAIGEAETSLERWLAEPMRSVEQGENAMQLVTHARRLANACTALDSRAVHDVANDEAGREGHLRAIASYGEGLLQRRARVE
jgi:uncharacterized membrane protein YccC